jgi:hypothetical protein
MLNGNSKRIVVIKDIPSNFIEEAILILKSEPNSKDSNKKKANALKGAKRENDFLLKEAEMIINSYVGENKVKASERRSPNPKPMGVKSKYMRDTIINIAMMVSIALLIFIVTRFL